MPVLGAHRKMCGQGATTAAAKDLPKIVVPSPSTAIAGMPYLGIWTLRAYRYDTALYCVYSG